MDEAIREAFLCELGDQLMDRSKKGRIGDIDYLVVRFFDGNKKRPIAEVPFVTALHSLVNNIYYFEEFDLRVADRIELGTM